MSRGSRGTVLLAFGESHAAPEAIFSLQAAGFAVAVLSKEGTRSPLRSIRGITLHATPDPAKEPHAAVARCAEVAAATGCRVFFPLEDIGVWLVEKGNLPPGVAIAGPTGSAAAFALDKRIQVAAAAAAGLSVPASISLDAMPADPDAVALPGDFPLILKPALAVHETPTALVKGRSWVVRDRAEFAAAIRAWGGSYPLLVQRVVRGEGGGVFGFVAADGMHAVSGHRRIRMTNPAGSGSSCCESVEPLPETRAATERLTSEVGWRGLFMVELLRDAEGVDRFVEVNGRPWGSMALARAQGLEYPAWAVELALDPTFRPPPVRARSGVRCRHLGRDLVHVLFVMRGSRGPSPTPWPSRPRAIWEVFGRDLLVRPYNFRRGDLRFLFADSLSAFLASVRKAARN